MVSDSRGRDVRSSTPAVPLLDSNLGQVVHTLMLLSPSSIIWYRPQGNDVLAMRHRLKWFIRPRT